MIGIDFDNTIVCYDDVFHRVAVEEGVIPASVGRSKGMVRDWLRAAGREDQWTALQGLVYGARIDAAPLFPGVVDFLRTCRKAAIPVAIVSHKTRHPFAGPAYDLHAAARDWLDRQGLFSDPDIGLTPDNVYFELTKVDKIARIASLKCRVFIDDLPELLADPSFPAGTRKILFDPRRLSVCPPDSRQVESWSAMLDTVVALMPEEGV